MPEGAGDARLDAALADRGLARSRTHAARLIAGGLVTVDGRAQVKPSFRVGESARLAVAAPDHYVSRAAQKIIAALDGFTLDVSHRFALDVGASTGGFTQVLLERNVDEVIALDVGHGQLSPRIRSDPRVITVEGFNARYMSAESLNTAAKRAVSPNLVTADLSFISLTTVLPALTATVEAGSDFVLLVKPQFEVGRSGIREGIVKNADLRTDAVNGVLWSAWDLGLGTLGVLSSPIAGTNGNHEYLVHLNAEGGTDPSEWSHQVTALARAG